MKWAGEWKCTALFNCHCYYSILNITFLEDFINFGKWTDFPNQNKVHPFEKLNLLPHPQSKIPILATDFQCWDKNACSIQPDPLPAIQWRSLEMRNSVCSNELLADFKFYKNKNNKRLLLKPLSYDNLYRSW